MLFYKKKIVENSTPTRNPIEIRIATSARSLLLWDKFSASVNPCIFFMVVFLSVCPGRHPEPGRTHYYFFSVLKAIL